MPLRADKSDDARGPMAPTRRAQIPPGCRPQRYPSGNPAVGGKPRPRGIIHPVCQSTGGAMAASPLFPPPHARPLTPSGLVGREREQRRLGALLAAASAGQGCLVLIGGEAGIGKTALVRALTAEVAAQGGAVLIGG